MTRYEPSHSYWTGSHPRSAVKYAPTITASPANTSPTVLNKRQRTDSNDPRHARHDQARDYETRLKPASNNIGDLNRSATDWTWTSPIMKTCTHARNHLPNDLHPRQGRTEQRAAIRPRKTLGYMKPSGKILELINAPTSGTQQVLQPPLESARHIRRKPHDYGSPGSLTARAIMNPESPAGNQRPNHPHAPRSSHLRTLRPTNPSHPRPGGGNAPH